MPQDGIQRVNICFPKDDNTTLAMIDKIRGNMPRSQAIQRMISYLTGQGEAWLSDFLKVPKTEPLDLPRDTHLNEPDTV